MKEIQLYEGNEKKFECEWNCKSWKQCEACDSEWELLGSYGEWYDRWGSNDDLQSMLLTNGDLNIYNIYSYKISL